MASLSQLSGTIAHALHFLFTRYLSVTRTVMSVNLPLIVLYMFSNRAVIVCLMRSIHRSREPRARTGTTFITGLVSVAIFLSVSIRVTSVYAVRIGVTDAYRKHRVNLCDKSRY